MKLRTPRFALREWIPSDFERQKKATKKLVALTNGVGSQSDAFKEAVAMLLKVAQTQPKQQLYASITSPLLARAYAYLLATHEGFAKYAFPTNAVLTQINSVKKPLGRLMTGYFVRAFFNEYDRQEREALGLLSNFIKPALVALPTNVSGEFALWRSHRDILFAMNGPKLVVDSAVTNNADLDNHFRVIGLGNQSNSAFVLQCRRIYYITVLETIPVGSDHPVLAELMKPEVYDAQYDSGYSIGRKALELLIDRSDAAGASAAWQRVVLGIAGDPRVGKHSRSFEKWWQLLKPARIKKVIGWLSRLDLKLFLEVLESSARQSGNADMQRMYVPRKVFMEGLLDQGMVISSRLFLSREAAYFLKRNYSKEDMPQFANVSSGATSVIYLELAGGLHMVEGTHSFKLKIFDEMPPGVDLTNYGKNRFTDAELRTGVISRYLASKEVDGLRVTERVNYIDQVHRGPVAWQVAAIELFHANGLEYTSSKFFDKDMYRVFKRTVDPSYW